ncbi:MAG TPA: molybdopterin-dependent oxidoreductase [Gemmataceae bacterium]|jgi:DMSO/TMAO reductase YedYZ molybdopterin-dependent catalytic subunit
MHELGFPLGVRLTHWFNFLFLTMLLRSGLAILSAHPKLYWNIHAWPTSEWLRLTRKKMPTDRMWCSSDEEVHWPGWLILPGGESLGFGRYWHFLNASCWLVVGLLYVLVLFLSPQWQRLVPTSWDIFPCAWRTMIAYLTFHTPEPDNPLYSIGPGRLPFNALQQLTYFGLIFFLTPFQIMTGLAQSPSLVARFPWYMRLFGNRQAARSLHFIGLVMFVVFFGIHLVMVFWHGFAEEMDKMVLGYAHSEGSWLGVALGLSIVTAVVLIHVAANVLSVKAPQRTYRFLALLVDPIRETFLHNLRSAQEYPAEEISPYFRTNGYPPIAAYPQAKGEDDTYERLLSNHFADYRLEVKGLVEHPHKFSLEELRALPKQEQTTLHHCIQGWSSVGRWGGVPLREILDRCKPLPQARYLVFTSFSKHEKSDQIYYECESLDIARHPQTILAYELNGQELPIQSGAPLRVRFETKLGFKMVKFLRSIEFVEDYRKIGGGMGGVREDVQHYDMGAEI